jgi:hypothetical protein
MRRNSQSLHTLQVAERAALLKRTLVAGSTQYISALMVLAMTEELPASYCAELDAWAKTHANDGLAQRYEAQGRLKRYKVAAGPDAAENKVGVPFGG